LITSVYENSSIETPTPNVLLSYFSTFLSHGVTNISTIGFSQLKIIIKRWMTFFTSYSIVFPPPTKPFTTHKNLKWKSNIKANILWIWWKSKVFKNSKKSFITFTTSYYMFMFNKLNSPSNWSNISFPSIRDMLQIP